MRNVFLISHQLHVIVHSSVKVNDPPPGPPSLEEKCLPSKFTTRLRALEISVSDPYHFDVDPDPRIRIRDDGSGSGL